MDLDEYISRKKVYFFKKKFVKSVDILPHAVYNINIERRKQVE